MSQKKKTNITHIEVGGKIIKLDWSKMPDDYELVTEEKKSDE